MIILKENKADYLFEQFNRIAKKYDLTNDLISLGMHRLWKQRAIQQLQIKKKGTYLDVCCGTGDVTILIAQSPEFQGEVTGLDFSPNMLAIAKARRERWLQDHDSKVSVRFMSGDALKLPFPDNSFDGAIISFGLRNLTDLLQGLNEMARVVKSQGRVVNLDLGHPTMPLFTPVFLFFFHNIVPLIGEIVQNEREAYTYLPESRKTYPKPEELNKMFVGAGMIKTFWQPLAFGAVALHVGTCP